MSTTKLMRRDSRARGGGGGGQPEPRLASSHEVDLLMLIREEEVYASRIKAALVFTESKIERLPAPLTQTAQAARDSRRALYARPTSAAEREDEEELELPPLPQRRIPCGGTRTPQVELVSSPLQPFINPDISLRKTVDDNDTLFSAESEKQHRIEFTYADLVAAQEGRKQINARALRRLANLWDKNPKLNKEAMLMQLIGEYARRYPQEVLANEARRSTTRGRSGARPRRRARRR